MTFGEMPADPNHPMSPEVKNMVLHARLNIAGTDVMFSDTPPGMMQLTVGNNVSLAVVSTNRDEIVRWYQQAEGRRQRTDGAPGDVLEQGLRQPER